MTDILADPSGCRRFIGIELSAPIIIDQPVNYEQYFRLCFAVTQDESEGQYMTTAAIYNKIKSMVGSSLGVSGISKFGQFLANLDGIVRKRTKVGTMYLVKPL